MCSVLKSLLGAFCAVVLLVGCASSGSAPVTSASLEPENVLTLGRAAPDSSAVPAPVVTASADVAAVNPTVPTAVPSDYAVATPTIQAEPAGGQNSYRLRARDFIRVLVINEPDTQIERRINSDGTVDIPFLKKLVPVAGLTLTQAQVELSNQFRVYFKKPQSRSRSSPTPSVASTSRAMSASPARCPSRPKRPSPSAGPSPWPAACCRAAIVPM